MKFTFRIAWRYIFSKKSTNAINIISGISMTGIIIGSASLIIVLSAFNGFENLVDRLYSTFYPDITISAAKGKVFVMDSSKIAQIQNIECVEYISKTLEENVLLAYNKQEHIATIKGVDTIYKYVTAVDDSVYYGDYILDYNYLNYTLNCAVLGSGVASTLNVSLGLDYPAIQIFMPRRGSKPSANPRNTFIQKGIQPMGVFRIQQEFDSKYVITSLGFISELLEYSNGEISTLEIKTSDKKNVNEIIEKIQLIIGEDYIIKNRFMQNEFLYRVMKTEKWAVYFILTFIFIIAAFNMIGSIAMLVIDKKKDNYRFYYCIHFVCPSNEIRIYNNSGSGHFCSYCLSYCIGMERLPKCFFNGICYREYSFLFPGLYGSTPKVVIQTRIIKK